MKRIITGMCTALAVFACFTLMPVTAFAEETRCTHTAFLVDAYQDDTLHVNAYQHQYVVENGPNGPIYGTCYAYYHYYCWYPVCQICGYIDYNHPHEIPLYTEHCNCGLEVVVHGH